VADKFVITESDIDRELDVLLESPTQRKRLSFVVTENDIDRELDLLLEVRPSQRNTPAADKRERERQRYLGSTAQHGARTSPAQDPSVASRAKSRPSSAPFRAAAEKFQSTSEPAFAGSAGLSTDLTLEPSKGTNAAAAGKEESPSKKKDEESIQNLQSFVDDNQRFHEEVLSVLDEEDIDAIVFLAQELPGLPSIALQEGTLGQSLKKWISRGDCGEAARALLPQLRKGKKYIAHELAKVKKYEDEEKDPVNQKKGVAAAVLKFSNLFKGALQVLDCSKEKPPEEECQEGQKKNEEGECVDRCPEGFHWVPTVAIAEAEEDTEAPVGYVDLPDDTEGKCVKDGEDEEEEEQEEEEPAAIVIPDLQIGGGATMIGGLQSYGDSADKQVTKHLEGTPFGRYAAELSALIRMFATLKLIQHVRSAAKKKPKTVEPPKHAGSMDEDIDRELDSLLEIEQPPKHAGGVEPDVLKGIESQWKEYLKGPVAQAVKDLPTREEFAKFVEKQIKALKVEKAKVDKNRILTKAYNEASGYGETVKKIMAKLANILVNNWKEVFPDLEKAEEKPEEEETVTEPTETGDEEPIVSLNEDKLTEIVIDFNEIRKNELNESFLAMFGAWIKHILGAMFGGFNIPVSVRGSKSEVESFARAIGSEKGYVETAKRYGLDHPNTYKSQARLGNAVKGFEKETGIKWPFK